MFKQACGLCKVVGAIAILGLLNQGVAALFSINLVEQVLGVGSGLTRAFYVLSCLSGLALLASFFMVCPKCKKP